MIRKWTVSNFKSVKDRTSLDFAPLTVFAGPNSSGKSTWIQSILLVTQSLSNRSSPQPITLNGFLVKLGEFGDLRSHGSPNQAITIGCDVSIPESMTFDVPEYDIECALTFDAPSNLPDSKLLQLQPSISRCNLNATVTFPEGEQITPWFAIQRTETRTPESTLEAVQPSRQSAKEAAKEPTSYAINFDTGTLEDIGEEMAQAYPTGCRLRQFLPSSVIVRFNQSEEEARVVVSAVCDFSRSRSRLVEEVTVPPSVLNIVVENFPEASQITGTAPLFGGASSITTRQWLEKARALPFQVRSELRRKMPQLRQQIHDAYIAERPVLYATAETGIPNDLLESAIRLLRLYFSSLIKYLGPLRDEPKPLYPLSPTIDPFDIGLKGEHTAAVLHIYKDMRISYVPSNNFYEPTFSTEKISGTLEGAVLDWLRYMDIAEKLSTDDRGKLGHEMKIVDPLIDMATDLTHVGVGVSQVLPILLMCLLAKPGATIILEQPELHLHPAVQSRLADFFISLALADKQCIVETHSEYIVNRLRLRAATAPGDSFSSLLKLYFVEKQKDASVFRDVAINRFGSIPDWPSGFFDQTHKEIEDILMAAARKMELEEEEKKPKARKQRPR